jgi:hydrogenase maturation protease
LQGCSDLQHPKQRIVIGLGNPILGDDGFGWIVAEEVRTRVGAKEPNLDIECFSLGGLSLMERLVDYDEAILIDAIHLGQSPAGTLQVFPLADIPDQMAGHLSSSHDTTLTTAIQMGKSLGAHLPESITIVGVETANSFDFSEELSAPVQAAVPIAVEKILQLLKFPG